MQHQRHEEILANQIDTSPACSHTQGPDMGLSGAEACRFIAPAHFASNTILDNAPGVLLQSDTQREGYDYRQALVSDSFTDGMLVDTLANDPWSYKNVSNNLQISTYPNLLGDEIHDIGFGADTANVNFPAGNFNSDGYGDMNSYITMRQPVIHDAASQNLTEQEIFQVGGSNQYGAQTHFPQGTATPSISNVGIYTTSHDFQIQNHNSCPAAAVSLSAPGPGPTAAQARDPLTGRFLCGHCMETFKHGRDQKRHAASVHGINQRLHLCHVVGCPKYLVTYSRADKLKEHMWKMHGDLGYKKAGK